MSSAGYLVVSLSLWHLSASVLSPSDCKHAEEGDFLWAVVSMRFPDVKPSLSAFGWWEVGTMSSSGVYTCQGDVVSEVGGHRFAFVHLVSRWQFRHR